MTYAAFTRADCPTGLSVGQSARVNQTLTVQQTAREIQLVDYLRQSVRQSLRVDLNDNSDRPYLRTVRISMLMKFRINFLGSQICVFYE
jgi:hypothetical protein